MRLERKVPLLHKTGLHLRPAKRIWDTANKFQSVVELVWKERSANAKSLLEMVALGVLPGSEIVFAAEGPDAAQALDELEELVLNSINRGEDM